MQEIKTIKKKTEKAYYCLILTPKYAMVTLATITLTFRLLSMRFKYLLGYDPYFHLAYIQYATEKGRWVNFFPYASGPWGMQINNFHPLGFWMAPAYIYKLFSYLGISLYNSFRITPVIFGTLTVIFTYISILNLYDKKKAFLSAFFLSVMFGHIFRSMAGYYRGDNYLLFWYVLGLSGISTALSKKERGGYRRLVFYVIPAFASSFSAIFWTAYYPIFVLFLGSAIFLAIAAFLLNEKDTFIDALTLIIATAFGAFLANAFGKYFGYGMAGMSKELGKALAREFGIQFGLIRDAVVMIFLKYVIPPSIGLIIILFILSTRIKEKKQKITLVAIGIITMLLFGIIYYKKVEDILLGLFPEIPITETQRTTFRDLWRAYGIAIGIAPAFFLSFISQRITSKNFVPLGFITIVIPLIAIWTRFLFIGSLAIAIMAGVGTIQLYEFLSNKASTKKLEGIVLIVTLLLVPAVTATQGLQNVLRMRPFVNDMWETSLTQLRAKTNPNDIILTWWDQGNWVIYYSKRAPVAQLAPDKFVAEYYLGMHSPESLMERGVDYIIVSYDTIAKFGYILKTANVSPEEYIIIPMPLVSSRGDVLLFSSGSYSMIVIPNKEGWYIQITTNKRILTPREAFVEIGRSVKRAPLSNTPNSNAYVYINLNYGYAVLMNKKTFETTLAKLMFTENVSNFVRIYSDGGYIKVFQFKHPNVIVTAKNTSVILKFSNATGTRLEIRGYLDNGTLVFKKEYNVTNINEFILPPKINESVVIRYSYIQEKTILDRGVFRIDDIITKKNP